MPDEEAVQRSLLPENPSNGGFPEPPPSMSVRIVAARHDACGHSTRVRLPSSIPARAVHRLRCDHCERAFEIGEVDDFGLESELNDLEKAVAVPGASGLRAAQDFQAEALQAEADQASAEDQA